MIASAGITAIGAEKTFIFFLRECYSEIVIIGIDGRFHVFDLPMLVFPMTNSFENIQSSHSGMTIGRKIESSVIQNIRKHFITRRINFRAKIYDLRYTFPKEFSFPNIFATVSARHIRNEIKITALRRYSRMRKNRKTVTRNNTQQTSQPPCSSGFFGNINGSRGSSFVAFGRKSIKQQRAIGCNRGNTFIQCRIEGRIDRLRFLPFAFDVFRRNKNIVVLQARNVADGVTRRFVARRSQIKRFAVGGQHGRKFAAIGIEHIGTFHHETRGVLFPDSCLTYAGKSIESEYIRRIEFQKIEIGLFCLRVLSPFV